MMKVPRDVIGDTDRLSTAHMDSVRSEAVAKYYPDVANRIATPGVTLWFITDSANHVIKTQRVDPATPDAWRTERDTDGRMVATFNPKLPTVPTETIKSMTITKVRKDDHPYTVIWIVTKR